MSRPKRAEMLQKRLLDREEQRLLDREEQRLEREKEWFLERGKRVGRIAAGTGGRVEVADK